MAPVTISPVGQRLVLTGIDWKTYRRLERIFSEQPGVRLTYDRGTLEIMTKSPEHERYNHLLRRLLEAVSDELAVEISGFGGFTFFRPRTRGLEPDECYYIANAPRVHGRDRIDLRTDPPPDLVIEVDLTSSSLNRMALYAAMGVTEVWQYDGVTLTFHVLGPGPAFLVSSTSQAFPWLAAQDLLLFLGLRRQLYEREIVLRFRAWLRQQQAAGLIPPAGTP
jgi:Uma2 family endonuclease